MAREEGQQDRPEEQRAPLAGPEARHLEEGVQVPVGVAGHVAVLELVRQEGVDDAEGSDEEKAEDQVDAPLGAEDQVTPLLVPPDEAHDHPPEGDGKGDPEGEFPERGHPAIPRSARSSGDAS